MKSAAHWGRVLLWQVVQHPSPQEPGALSRGLATSPPLNFPASNKRAPSPFWIIPMPSSGQVWGAEEACRGLNQLSILGSVGRKWPGNSWGLTSGSTQEEEAAETESSSHLACSPWGHKSESRERLRPGCPLCSGKNPCPSTGSGGATGPTPEFGDPTVAADHWLLDSKGVGGEEWGASASSTPRVTSETQYNRQEAKFI
jgi:hypothetical protein